MSSFHLIEFKNYFAKFFMPTTVNVKVYTNMPYYLMQVYFIVVFVQNLTFETISDMFRLRNIYDGSTARRRSSRGRTGRTRTPPTVNRLSFQGKSPLVVVDHQGENILYGVYMELPLQFSCVQYNYIHLSFYSLAKGCFYSTNLPFYLMPEMCYYVAACEA